MSPGLRLIVTTVLGRRRPLAWALIGALGYSVAVFAGPLLVKLSVDDGIAARHVEHIPIYVAVAVASGVLRGVFGGMRKFHAAVIAASAGNDLRSRMFDHLQRLSFSYHDRFGVGELMSRASYDASTIELALNSVPAMTQTVVLAAAGVVFMAVLQPALALLILVSIVLTAIPAVLLSLPVDRLARALQSSVGDLTQFFEQSVNGIRVIKGHGLEAAKEFEGEQLIDGVYGAGMHLVRRRALFITAFGAVPTAASIVTLVYGGWLTLAGRMSAGELFAFLIYLGVLIGLVPLVQQMLTIWPQALASGTRILEVLSAEPDVAEPPLPQTVARRGGEVRLERVTFGYVTEAPVLRDLSLEIRAGHSLALVGASGSGKSTIAKLIPRFYDPWQGRVLFDGTDVRELRLAELRRAVSIVFEETVTFSATVAENIGLGVPGASRADIERAARLANADEFITELPETYDTMLGEQGFTISGGQRQRLAIARAVLRDPDFLILDDATSALDAVSQARITAALRDFMDGRTTLVIAHRPETLALAEEVALIDEGRLVARGSHAELLAFDAYRRALGIDAPWEAAL